MDAFLGGYEAALAALEPEALERHRAALIAAKLQKDRGLADEASRHWEQIATRRCARSISHKPYICREMSLLTASLLQRSCFIIDTLHMPSVTSYLLGKFRCCK